ncbi:uncharacterized protein LOC119394326 isoform X1 [Rhipicephalus sanguineus]|uniref:uncharacterized protein LOC119394326 isoform X1 n=1 Tax=Rhipicephalus sanguineus TaxID=34632 RepID=UPI0020C1BA65|nr:uncharacterized protein LOC119394326 isoform X1 [Rhipicephalus sanguineus]
MVVIFDTHRHRNTHYFAAGLHGASIGVSRYTTLRGYEAITRPKRMWKIIIVYMASIFWCDSIYIRHLEAVRLNATEDERPWLITISQTMRERPIDWFLASVVNSVVRTVIYWKWVRRVGTAIIDNELGLGPLLFVVASAISTAVAVVSLVLVVLWDTHGHRIAHYCAAGVYGAAIFSTRYAALRGYEAVATPQEAILIPTMSSTMQRSYVGWLCSAVVYAASRSWLGILVMDSFFRRAVNNPHALDIMRAAAFFMLLTLVSACSLPYVVMRDTRSFAIDHCSLVVILFVFADWARTYGAEALGEAHLPEEAWLEQTYGWLAWLTGYFSLGAWCCFATHIIVDFDGSASFVGLCELLIATLDNMMMLMIASIAV